MPATLAPPTADELSYCLLYDHQTDPRYYDTIQEYRGALVWAALVQGSIPLDQERLNHLDQGIAQAVISLPKDLEPHQARLDEQLHDLRLRVQRRIEAHRQAWKALEAKIYQPAPEAQALDDRSSQAPQTPQDQAVRLMRAALLLIMDRGEDRPEGGTRVPLVPPPPTRPPGGSALRVPTKPVPSTDIQF